MSVTARVLYDPTAELVVGPGDSVLKDVTHVLALGG
jgi:hypothetical protein